MSGAIVEPKYQGVTFCTPPSFVTTILPRCYFCWLAVTRPSKGVTFLKVPKCQESQPAPFVLLVPCVPHHQSPTFVILSGRVFVLS